jgi:pimeloyl-ACP methyl ester carboxylesterase
MAAMKNERREMKNKLAARFFLGHSIFFVFHSSFFIVHPLSRLAAPFFFCLKKAILSIRRSEVCMRETICGAEVYYEQHGQGKPDVLLLHGWGCDASIWRPVAARLAARARVIVPDFPGHGQSGRPPVPWGAEEYAAMVAALIRTLGIEGCDVVGHSHGGRIALLLAATEPALVGKLVLTGAAGLRRAPTPAQRRRQAAYRRLRKLAGALGAVKPLRPLAETLAERLRRQYGSPDYNALDAEMRKTFVKIVNFDVLPFLPRVAAPTLLLWGTGDAETPPWMAETMRERIPDAGLVWLQGGTHYAFLEKISEFLLVTEQFLLGGSP